LDILDNLSLGLNPFGGDAMLDAIVASVIDSIGEPPDGGTDESKGHTDHSRPGQQLGGFRS
jgi:hypothetical protein